ncbi:MAG: T9SS type A sorting domain-containing protein [Bacteroidales bacterium]|jgi:PKD repeat protein|nr:T9SS type A sorting domain-containing protein [Bacteroidales bacterium]
MKNQIKLFIVIITTGICMQAKAQTWDTLPGLNVYSMALQFKNYNDTLIIAGSFRETEFTDSYCVVGWDSINMYSFPGIDDYGSAAYSVSVYNGDLILGGAFDIITTDEDIEKLAIWNGTSWEQLGGIQWQHQMEVRFLTEYQDSLYIGGPGIYCPEHPELVYLITWNGSTFSGTSFSNRSRALCVYDDKLYSGMNSTFQLPNGEWLHGIAAYENGHWDHVYRKNGNPFTASVTDMFVDTINNDLYLGSVYLYRYDGEIFHNIAQLGGMVYEHAMCMYRGNLYIGGNFTIVNGIPVNYMAKWDGTEWSGENLGASNVLTALYEYKNELYVGGAFDTVAGFLPAHGIARYHEPPPSDCHWLRPRVQTAVHEDTFYLTSTNPELSIDFINNNAYAENWQWSFDGDTPFAAGDTVSNTYNEPGTYTISIEVSQDGCLKTAEKQIVVEDITGISHKLSKSDIQLYPNPVLSTLHLKLTPQDKNIPVSVINQAGKTLIQDSIPAGNSRYALNVHTLSAGTYVLRIDGISKSFSVLR